MTEKGFLKGFLAVELVVWVGCIYALGWSLFMHAGWWMVLCLAILCVQGLLVLYMTAHRFRYGLPEPYPAVRRVSSVLTWVALLSALYPVYASRMLWLIGR